ncbi:histidine kinase [Kitasatospora sp. NPDC093806]|uniref:sensor histidine kinase n=1 Tax=Kitasatospora sp. NPDC093806 TaxID=3155075 RepID=UPI00342F14B4
MIGQVLAAAAAPGAALLGLAARRRYGWPVAVAVVAGAAGAVSLTVTAGAWAVGRWGEADRLPALVSLAELGVLLLTVALAVRLGRGWNGPVAASAAGAAVLLWPSRFEGFTESGGPLTLVGFGAVLLGPAALAGRYLRGLDDARRRSVAAARGAQRLELAHDLHDFVAHDVSGMVALAQAGTVLAASDPVRAAELFERIERAGQQALGSLDRTVHLLRTAEPDRAADPAADHAAERAPQPGLADLAALAERFAESGGASVRLEAPGEGAEVPREVAATAYRIVVEALTNVRRHAPGARAVTVRVRRAGGRLEVTVTDDGAGGAPATGARRGGSGLAGLAARAEALGGTLTAGRGDGGWRLAATFPLEGR